MSTTLEISLFGPCVVRLVAGPNGGTSPVDIRGAKHRALLVLLATAPMGRRARAYLQETLWGVGNFDSGHQNLRRALADLRKLMGPAFSELITTTVGDVELSLESVRLRGSASDGAFLEDLDIRVPGFVAWRDHLSGDKAALGALTALGARQTQRASGRVFPTVCALPLFVPDNDPTLAVAADWAAEEICRMLSRSSFLSVISHLSTRTMAQRFVDISQVRETLGVDYLLIGTLRRSGTDLVADFDFIDAATGVIAWNRNLTCPEARLSEDLPDRLSNVVRAIGRSIASMTLRDSQHMSLPELEDHQLLMAAIAAMHGRTLGNFLSARQYLDEAERRDRRSAVVQAWLGKWHTLSIFKGYTTDRTADTSKAQDHAARALDIEPENSFALTIDGFIHGNILADIDIADRRYRAAQDVNPNESLAWLLRGSLLAFVDDGRAAIRATDQARRLSPIDPFGYYYDSLAGSAHLAAGNYARALDLAERSLMVNDRHLSTLRIRIAALHALERGDEARTAAAELSRRFPEFTLAEYRKTHPSATHKTGKLVIEALTASGIS